ncbi:LPS export ABC transporter permease LptG [Halothiobacillus sp. DCM-1]|uniref:LPS export ABC transporter permease LptG n=1 Tax=Halothiobacillus sp. DCM-1 TaxID=3112558 RepID=UPI00324999E9
MGVLDRYLIRTVVLGGLGSTAAFALLIVVFGAIDELSRTGGNYGFWQALAFVVLTMPGYLYDFYPVAILVGGLLALGGLAAHSELTVMRTAGMSMMRLARPVLVAGVILALLGMLMGETVGAWGQEKAKQMRAQLQDQGVSMNLKSGLWMRDGHRFINVRQALVGGRLNEVRVFTLNAQGLPESMMFAQYATSEGGDRWRLHQVEQTRLLPSATGGQVVTQSQAELSDVPLFSQAVLRVAVLNPHHMNIVELLRYVRYLNANHLDATNYLSALWGRIFAPVSVLVMLFITLPFVFAPQRGGGAGRWLFIGILLGVVYLTLVQILSAFAPVYGAGRAWVSFFSASLPPMLFAGLGYWAMRRWMPGLFARGR